MSNNEIFYRNENLNELIDPSDIQLGGEFIPPNCLPDFSTAIIIPYRKRPDQLKAFLIYIHNFLRRQQIHYRIFVVEQFDEKPFNRAKLLNVGAVYAIQRKFPCLIFHDIDLFPMNLGNLYVCTALPRHMSVQIDKFYFNLIYEDYVGGSISMQTDVYQAINGLSNIASEFTRDFCFSFILKIKYFVRSILDGAERTMTFFNDWII